MERLQTDVEPRGLWRGGHAPRSLPAHLAPRHCPLQQVGFFSPFKGVFDPLQPTVFSPMSMQ